jgi:hypothetical protein
MDLSPADATRLEGNTWDWEMAANRGLPLSVPSMTSRGKISATTRLTAFSAVGRFFGEKKGCGSIFWLAQA